MATRTLKQYARQCLQTDGRAWSTLITWMNGFRWLSESLAHEGIDSPALLDRDAFLRYMGYARREGLADLTVKRHAGTISRVLEDLKYMGFISELGSEAYLRSGEAALVKKRMPRPYPTDILDQIDARIVDNPEVDAQIRLMVMYCRWAGPRASELVELPIDCIRITHEGKYWIEYFQPKVRSYRRFPVPLDLGQALVAHRLEVLNTYGASARHMFPQPRSSNSEVGVTRAWSDNGFRIRLRELFGRLGISQSALTGELVTGGDIHRYRHSQGTNLLNNGWTQLEVQNFLGHESSQMTAHYAQITDTTLDRKAEEFHAGQKEAREQRAKSDDPTVEKLRRRITAVLPHGGCALPEHLSCSVRDKDPCTGCAFFEARVEDIGDTQNNYRKRLKLTVLRADREGDERIREINQHRLDELDEAAPERVADAI